ncbi:hypothetical protein BA896_014695 [Janthinobacterium lividum]|uniref:Uncharacterized protein n=1 Tax=Janthinobacterium lividum TaxID=29581 RepID=A0A1E8PUB4_9BURK|nr:hypothetical protein BA896_014695 [Janthinobacterium lividum]
MQHTQAAPVIAMRLVLPFQFGQRSEQQAKPATPIELGEGARPGRLCPVLRPVLRPHIASLSLSSAKKS